MSRYISKKDRLFVKERAHSCCEYCRIPELFSFIGFELDHIIPIKHHGTNGLDNLAWACAICNNFKGTDFGTFLLPSRTFIPFYNPRIDTWDEHFKISNSLILPYTDIAKGTIKILQLNDVKHLKERESLMAAKLFPPPNFRLES